MVRGCKGSYHFRREFARVTPPGLRALFRSACRGCAHLHHDAPHRFDESLDVGRLQPPGGCYSESRRLRKLAEINDKTQIAQPLVEFFEAKPFAGGVPGGKASAM